jgi:hypothetical protein
MFPIVRIAIAMKDVSGSIPVHLNSAFEKEYRIKSKTVNNQRRDDALSKSNSIFFRFGEVLGAI